MPEFYYQIKGRSAPDDLYGNWAFPPVFSGKVEAKDKAEAKALIEEEYGRAFPLRVLKKDLDQHAYLLSIRPVTSSDKYLLRQFETMNCKECQLPFRLIDKYNDHHCTYKGPDYCSRRCYDSARQREIRQLSLAHEGKVPPVIYQVRQKSTGMSYVGQTIRPFTLRWWEHLTVLTDSKFHTAIKSTPLTDWEFSLLEVIEVPVDTDPVAYITARERHWIEAMNSIQNGFNAIRPAGLEEAEVSVQQIA